MDPTPDFRAAHESWRQERMAKLSAGNGWLNLLGRWPVAPGNYAIGSGAASDIRLPVGPERLGTLVIEPEDRGRFHSESGAEILLDRAAGLTEWRAGRFLMEITALNDLRALRIRDSEAPARSHPPQIDFFPLDPALRITAIWEPLPALMDLTLDTIIGIPTRVPVTHVARFEIAGHQMAMLPTYGTPERPQFVLRDLTSLDDSYAKARFIFGEEVTETSVVIDFNRAINPPCAFTDHAICPLPPRENLIPARIEAGERRLARGQAGR